MACAYDIICLCLPSNMISSLIQPGSNAALATPGLLKCNRIWIKCRPCSFPMSVCLSWHQIGLQSLLPYIRHLAECTGIPPLSPILINLFVTPLLARIMPVWLQCEFTPLLKLILESAWCTLSVLRPPPSSSSRPRQRPLHVLQQGLQRFSRPAASDRSRSRVVKRLARISI